MTIKTELPQVHVEVEQQKSSYVNLAACVQKAYCSKNLTTCGLLATVQKK